MKIKSILLQIPAFLCAKVKVLTLIPAFSMIAYDVGQEKVLAESLFDAPYDVHHILLKPSQLQKLADADLIIATPDFVSYLKGYEDKVLISPSKASNDHYQKSLHGNCSCPEHDHHDHHHVYDDHVHHDHSRFSHEQFGEHSSSYEDPSQLLGHLFAPHSWLSFEQSELIALSLKNYLVTQDPENSDFYTKNYEAFVEKSRELTAEYRQQHRSKNVLLHDSFFHLSKELNRSFGLVLKKCHDSQIIPSALSEVVNSPQAYQRLIVEKPMNTFLVQKILTKTELSLTIVDTLGYDFPMETEYHHFLRSLLEALEG